MIAAFFWFVGLQFTIGITSALGDDEHHPWWELFILLMAWPWVLGICVGDFLKPKEEQPK